MSVKATSNISTNEDTGVNTPAFNTCPSPTPSTSMRSYQSSASTITRIKRALTIPRTGCFNFCCCCCGPDGRKLRPWEILLIIAGCIAVVFGAALIGFYVVVPIKVVEIMRLPEMVPLYTFSDIRNDSFQVHIDQNVFLFSPIAVEVDPFYLSLYAREDLLGYVGSGGYRILPGQNITMNHTDRFRIVNEPLLKSVGNQILLTLTSPNPSNIDVLLNSLQLSVRTVLTVHCLGFSWQVPYTRYILPLPPGAPSQFPEPPPMDGPPVEVKGWRVNPYLGVTIDMAVQNPVPIQADLDRIELNIAANENDLGKVVISDLSIVQGANLLPISVYTTKIFKAIGFGISFLGNRTEMVSFRNITVTTSNQEKVEWLNGFFENLVMTVPFSKTLLAEGSTKEQTSGRRYF